MPSCQAVELKVHIVVQEEGQLMGVMQTAVKRELTTMWKLVARYFGMSVLLGACAWMLVVLAGCGSGGNPPPPVPTPPPPVTEAPPGVHHTKLTLRRAGSKFTTLEGQAFDLRQAIPCCGSFAGSGWPIAIGPDWVMYTIERGGANTFHARPGPMLAAAEPEWPFGAYVEVGGKADLTKWNPEFWKRFELWVYLAGEQGARVEVDITEGWRRRTQMRGEQVWHPWAPQNNVQGVDALSLHGGDFTGVQRAYFRKLVSAVGRFGGVIWLDGTEMDLVPGYTANETWELRKLIRQLENEFQYPVHIFGTNGSLDAASGPVDYVARHGSPLRAPLYNKPTLVNEYNGEPPPRPDQWMASYCIARRSGTYYAYWRQWPPQTDAQMEATLALWKGGDCSFLHKDHEIPDAEAPGWGAPIPAANHPITQQSRKAIKDVMNLLQKPCGRDMFVTLELAAYELRHMGFYASGPWDDAVGLREGQFGLELHFVAAGTGCWTGEPYKMAWPWPGVWP